MGKYGTIKRSIDILFSLILLIVSSPILIFAMIAIKLDSKGPIFFVHERVGYKGRTFRMIKLRGMVDNALAIGPELTQSNDPRITRVGKLLRRTSIDEIPQVFNVLKGEMSLIGPRPEMTSIVKTYSNKEKEVFEFKPGITGISQINGRQLLTPSDRVKMEIEYYKEATFFSDLKILLKTFKVVVSNEGNI